MKHLVVTSQFGSFQIGDRIEDQDLVAQYAASHPAHVVAVMAPAAPAAAQEPAEATEPAPEASTPAVEPAAPDHEETEH